MLLSEETHTKIENITSKIEDVIVYNVNIQEITNNLLEALAEDRGAVGDAFNGLNIGEIAKVENMVAKSIKNSVVYDDYLTAKLDEDKVRDILIDQYEQEELSK